MPSPRVSICIPTFDRLTYLREAVASARAQTFHGIEILIGDDGESAELQAWCLSQAAEDPRVRYQRTPARLRLAGNWNFLAGLARGEYVTFIGDDDRLLPTFVERLVEKAPAEASSGAVVFSNHFIIDADGRRLVDESYKMTRTYGRGALREGPVENAPGLVWSNSVPMLASIIRAREVKRLGFKNDINTPELELFARMASEGARFLFVDDYLAEYRVHPQSESARGLTLDRLAEHLERVDVSKDDEPAKRDGLRSILVAGVAIRLQRGDIQGARSLSSSPYYPRETTNARAWAQRLILALPDALVAPIYGPLRRLYRSMRQTRLGRPA